MMSAFRIQFPLWRILLFLVVAFAAATLASLARAQHGGGMHGGGMGGFHGGGMGGFHGGGMGGFHGDGHFHGGGCCFFGFGFGGWPFWPFSYGYAPYYPSYPAYPYYPPYPPATAMPPAMPGNYTGPALPPGVPVSFAVYFATGSDRLSPAAHDIIAKAAASEAHGNAQIAVAGFTDTVGNSASNLDLSRRRAENVRAGLIAAGVPQHLIALVWHGENGPQVPTADGIAEARNRRVVILLGAPPPPVS